MKKILYVELSSGFGGSSEALYSNLKYLDKGCFDASVIIAKDGQNFNKMKDLGVRVEKAGLINISDAMRNNILSYFIALLNLMLDVFVNMWIVVSIIKKNDIDLVHINTNIKNNIHVILACKIARVPCVCHMRGTRALTWKERFFGKFIDKIVILNEDARKIMETHFAKDRVVLVSDGIDLNNYEYSKKTNLIREEFGLNGHFSVGVIGRVVEGKGQDDFIRAAAIAKKKNEKVKFLIVGDDPDGGKKFLESLKMLAQELDVLDCVIFTGWREDKNDIICALDAVVQSTSTFPEGAPLIISETMALEKPAIATRIAGSSEMVADQETGFLVEPANPDAMANAVLTLANDPELAKTFGKAGKLRVSQLFDIVKNTKKMEEMYLSLDH